MSMGASRHVFYFPKVNDVKTLTELWLGTKPWKKKIKECRGSWSAKIGGPERLLVWQE